MSKLNKIIVFSVVDLVLFVMSFILLINDLDNYFITIATLTLVLLIYLFYIVLSKNDEVSIYKKKLKKILKTYDSILIYMEEQYKFGDENVMFVKKFEDLLIAKDEVNNPILFVDEGESSVFLLEDENNLLVYVMKQNTEVVSKMELKLLEQIYLNNIEPSNSLLDDLDKTTIIQLKNNKLFKVSPVRK